MGLIVVGKIVLIMVVIGDLHRSCCVPPGSKVLGNTNLFQWYNILLCLCAHQSAH